MVSAVRAFLMIWEGNPDMNIWALWGSLPGGNYMNALGLWKLLQLDL